jgi:FkbM family methyltransferase
MFDLLQILMKDQKGAFVDVGANIGQTLLKVKATNSEMDYIGFEPNPACVYYLNELIKANSFERVRIIPVGLSIETGIKKLTFYNDNLDDGSASIINRFRPNNKIYKEENIPVFAYNDLAKSEKFGDISILKIDVEGAEYEVLTTLSEVVRQNKPTILIEILPVYSLELSERLDRQILIEKMLKDLDYLIFRIFPKKETIELRQIAKIGIHSDINHCDYICLPQESLQDFKGKSSKSKKVTIQY